jgi:phosphoglycerate dehydrogenase-like enzyme
VLVCPLTAETTGLINGAALAAMKPTAYLINCARGKVADEEALIEALQDNVIRGAGLDVMATEPLPPDSPLWTPAQRLPHAAHGGRDLLLRGQCAGPDDGEHRTPPGRPQPIS